MLTAASYALAAGVFPERGRLHFVAEVGWCARYVAHVAEPLPESSRSERARVREFFGPRAETWDARFPDDEAAFSAAIRALHLPLGGSVLDAGCGTGRAVALLREAVGRSGTVVGLDATPEMLGAADRAERRADAAFVLGDACRPPIRSGTFDGVLAAGLISHLTDPLDSLQQLASVTRVGGHLALFHPIGRATLAARHGHALRPDDIRSPDNVRPALDRTGWHLVEIDDGESRYLAVARRRG
jgi:SAM-dependent methyltransferase